MNAAQKKRREQKVSAEGPEKTESVGPARRRVTFVLSANKRMAKEKSNDDQEKIVLVTTMALFANIEDSW